MGDVRLAVDLNGVRTEMDGKAALVATHEGGRCRVAVVGAPSPIELAQMLSSAIVTCMGELVNERGADIDDALRSIAAAVNLALGEEE